MANYQNEIQPYTVSDDQQQYYPDPNVNQNYYDQNNFYQQEPPKRKIPLQIIILGAVLILILIVGLLSILGRNRTSTTTNNPTRNINLQWWGAYLDPEVINPLLEEYKIQNPNVTIEYANKISPVQNSDIGAEDYRAELNRVINSADSVQMPDIFMVENTWAGDYTRYITPSSVIDFNTFNNNFYPAVVKDFASDGNVNGIPLWIDNLAIVYNKDFLSQVDSETPPARWTDFRNVARDLTTFQGNSIERGGFAAGKTENVSFYYELVNVLLKQNDVDIVDSQNIPVFSQNSNSVEALAFYQSFADSANPTWSSNLKNDSAAFLDQEVAMIASTSWRLRQILRYNEQYQIGIDIGVAPIPQIAVSEDEFYNWATYWGNMVAKNRPNSQAAWTFLNWITQPEQLRKIHENIKQQQGYFGQLYPRKDMTDDLSSDLYLNVYNNSLIYSDSWLAVKGIEVKNVLKNILDRNVTESALESAESEIKSLIAQKGILSE